MVNLFRSLLDIHIHDHTGQQSHERKAPLQQDCPSDSAILTRSELRKLAAVRRLRNAGRHRERVREVCSERRICGDLGHSRGCQHRDSTVAAKTTIATSLWG
eukprot:4896399-Prymnesium_polylepis.2